MHQVLLIFAVFPIVYSISFFGWCYLAEKKPIFSKRNSRPKSSVICGHVAVLLVLIMLAQIGFQFYQSLPAWFTDKVIPGEGMKYSCFELLCIVSVLVIGAAEIRWIYVDRRIDDPGSKDGLS
jgi:hypothetical protein